MITLTPAAIAKVKQILSERTRGSRPEDRGHRWRMLRISISDDPGKGIEQG